MLYEIRLLQNAQNQSDFYFMWLYILHDLANKLWVECEQDRSLSVERIRLYERSGEESAESE